MFNNFSFRSFFISVAILLVIFLMVDAASGYVQQHNGTIVDKEFTAAYTETRIEMETYWMGKVAQTRPVVKYYHHPDRWQLVVKDRGTMRSIEVGQGFYNSKLIGDAVPFLVYYGKYTGIEWRTKISY